MIKIEMEWILRPNGEGFYLREKINQPERLNPEAPERGCDSLNSVETQRE
jgi:hypothetical protein